MTPSTDQALTGLARRRTAVVVVAALALGSLGFSGCGVISKVKAAVHTVEGNKSTMDAFTNKIKSGATTFEVTYMTTGISPATVVYAVEPSKGLLFKLTQTPSSNNSGSRSSRMRACDEIAENTVPIVASPRVPRNNTNPRRPITASTGKL